MVNFPHLCRDSTKPAATAITCELFAEYIVNLGLLKNVTKAQRAQVYDQ